MNYVNVIAEAGCIIIGVIGIAVGVAYRGKVSKTPLTEAMWAAGFGQMWLGTAFYGLDGQHAWRLSLVALGVALAQYRIWSALHERASARVPA